MDDAVTAGDFCLRVLANMTSLRRCTRALARTRTCIESCVSITSLSAACTCTTYAQAHARRLEAGLLELITKVVPMDDLLAKVAAIVRPLMQPGVDLRVRIDEARDYVETASRLRRDCVEIVPDCVGFALRSGRKILAAPSPRLDAS